MTSDALILRENPMPAAAKQYIHTRTFFQHNRWDAHDFIGELMARGITQLAVALQGDDWTIAWREPTPPNVVNNAEKTPA